MAGFGRIRCDKSSFLANNICLDRDETIKAFEEDDTHIRLLFLVLGGDACISDC